MTRPTSPDSVLPATKGPLIRTEIPGPRSRALVSAEAANLAPGVQSIATLSGLAVARAEGSVIEDVDGNRFLDLAAGICVNALGHGHPTYRRVLKQQIDEVTVGSFTTERRAEAAERQLVDVDHVSRVPDALLFDEEHRVVGCVRGEGKPGQPDRHVLEPHSIGRPVEDVGRAGEVRPFWPAHSRTLPGRS